MKSDQDIQEQVQNELRWDSRLKRVDIGVSVQDGIDTLDGSVNSFAQRQAAQQAALHVTGILDVANNIEVELPARLTRTDNAIANAVRMALEWHALIPSQRIRATVTHGGVTLYGTVDSWRQVAEAESVVGNIAGVRDVVSELVVSAPEIDAHTIEHDIEEALERRSDRTARHIQVGVHDGLVTLSGGVNSLAEREPVLGAARFTHGVRRVEDHLRANQSTED